MAVCWVILRGQQNLHCYTSCTLTTLHCSKVSFLQCVTWKDIIKYLQKCEGCTHFCEILYMNFLRYANLRNTWTFTGGASQSFTRARDQNPSAPSAQETKPKDLPRCKSKEVCGRNTRRKFTLQKLWSYSVYLCFSQEASTSSSPLSTPSSSAAPSRSPSSTSGLSSGFLPSPSPSQSSRAIHSMLGHSHWLYMHLHLIKLIYIYIYIDIYIYIYICVFLLK